MAAPKALTNISSEVLIMANREVYLSLLVGMLYLTGCTYHPVPVKLIDTQARLIRRIRDEGHVLHPLTEAVCVKLQEAPLGVTIPCPYGFHHFDNGVGWIIEVWKDAPVGANCVISHERKHLPVINGKIVRTFWHKGAHSGC